MNKKEIEEFATMKADIQYIKEGLEINNTQHKAIMDKLDTLDTKFAGKWVESVQIGIIITVASAVIGAVIYLI